MTDTHDKECLDCMQTKLHCFVCTKCLDQLRRDFEEVGHERGFKLATDWYEREIKTREEGVKQAKKELLDEMQKELWSKSNVIVYTRFQQFRAKTLGEQVKKE